MGEGEAVEQGEICTLESSHIPTRPDPLLFALRIHGGCTFEGGKERAILREWRKQGGVPIRKAVIQRGKRSMKAGVPFNGRRGREGEAKGITGQSGTATEAFDYECKYWRHGFRQTQ